MLKNDDFAEDEIFLETASVGRDRQVLVRGSRLPKPPNPVVLLPSVLKIRYRLL
jgi:uncharacterized protein YprB with RNaseH-like and TPR domain